MKKQKKEKKDWTEHLRNHRENCDLAQEDLKEIEDEYQDGTDIQPLLHRFREKMKQIHWEANWLWDEMYVAPIRTVFSVDRLKITKQQYWLLRAAGVELFTAKGLGICPVDDYEVYKNCVYEDDAMVCFMDPNENPEVETKDEKTGRTKIRVRIAKSPEEVELKHFRPDQKRFFAKYRPDVLAKVQKTKQGPSKRSAAS